jgi:YHS domain-containing protein
MQLKEEEIRETLLYQERRYYFCSDGCRAEFQRHPEDYAEKETAGRKVGTDV